MTTVIAKQTRNAGTYTSGSVAVPPTVTGVAITGLLSAADLADTTLQVRVAIEASYDVNALTWIPFLSGIWVGGTKDRAGNFVPPFMSYSSSSPWPLWARGVLDMNQRISAGLDVTIT